MPETADVVIIGGGVMGCSVAYQLAKLGIQSLLLERGRLAAGASGATAGMVSPLWHVNHDNEALFDLGMTGLSDFPKLALELSEAGIDPEFRQCGIIKVAMNSGDAGVVGPDRVVRVGGVELDDPGAAPHRPAVVRRRARIEDRVRVAVVEDHEVATARKVRRNHVGVVLARGQVVVSVDDHAGLPVDDRDVTVAAGAREHIGNFKTAEYGTTTSLTYSLTASVTLAVFKSSPEN